MITEDYCSFELSKLLKEKGFDVPIDTYFHNGNDFVCENYVTNWNAKEEYVSRPSQSLAMKWLREVHRKYIDIRYNNQNEEYRFIVFTMIKDKPIDFIHSEYHSTYEEAVEAAIKYCLTNLIKNETN